MDKSNAIEIRDLVKSYKQFKALDGISFDVSDGDFFGFLGPNGAGKTTTISVLTGLANYSSGSVKVFGYDVMKDYRQTRALIGLVPQEFNFDPFLTAEQILTYEGGYFGVPEKQARTRARELLAEFNLEAYRGHDFRKLSGGLKRRLLIARALVHKPKILILDEPTAGVDLELRYRLWDFFKDLNQKGITIFLTTHYIEEAEKLCDRIGVIHQGKMIAVDDKEKLMQRMNQDMIEIKLDRKMEIVPKDLSEMGVVVSGSGVSIRLAENNNALAKLLKTIHAHGIEVLGVEIKKTRLEDVFLELTKTKE